MNSLDMGTLRPADMPSTASREARGWKSRLVVLYADQPHAARAAFACNRTCPNHSAREVADAGLCVAHEDRGQEVVGFEVGALSPAKPREPLDFPSNDSGYAQAPR